MRRRTGEVLHPRSPWVEYIPLRGRLVRASLPRSVIAKSVHSYIPQWFIDTYEGRFHGWNQVCFRVVENHEPTLKILNFQTWHAFDRVPVLTKPLMERTLLACTDGSGCARSRWVSLPDINRLDRGLPIEVGDRRIEFKSARIVEKIHAGSYKSRGRQGMERRTVEKLHGLLNHAP